MARHTVQTLASGWEFKSDTDEKWLSVSQMPSNVHLELMHHGLLPDPFIGQNELAGAWVAERTWHYRTTFHTPETDHAAETHVDLVFEGLDTFAAVTVNGHAILESDNMFIEHRVSISELLLPDGTENTLELVFEPARRKGLELVKAHPEHDFIVHQTEISRGPVRKAQYHWGWDWGPILLTCGPWKPVRLETYVSRIDDIYLQYDITTEGSSETLEATIQALVVGPAAEIEAELTLPGKAPVQVRARNGGPSDAPSWSYESGHIRVSGVPLWWPRGYGPQNLCELSVRIFADDGHTVLDEQRQTIGLRKVELVQEDDKHGKSFYFRVNGVDIFAGGSCWIPADSFLPRITPERYRDWISLLAEGNQNMIRVWGGGVYEPKTFYSACDELGILVWQDFMFACASYPTYPTFLASVEAEARQNVRRLRHHPSIVLWCGNNEDYQLIERYNLDYNFTSDKDPQSWLRSSFPARYIYEHLLPTVVHSLLPPLSSSSAVYHPGSPWGNGTSTTLAVDPTVGDIHQWELWNGAARPWQHLRNMGGRFVSEFGMPAYPHLETLKRCVPDREERYPGSATVEFHNKAVAHERRMLAYLGENFRVGWWVSKGAGAMMDRKRGDPEEEVLGAFAYLTQVLQADAVGEGYKAWRRQWGGRGRRRCGGVLVWQLNDCWPAISWAIVDYYLVKKPAWYAIKRAMAPLAVGVTRKFHDCMTRPADELWRRDTGHVDPRKALTDIEFDVWVSSSRLETVEGKVVVRSISVRTGEEVRGRLEERLELQANGCTEVFTGKRFDWDEAAVAKPEHFVIHVSLWVDGAQVSSDTSWPDPLKHLDFRDRGVTIDRVGEGLVEVSAEKPVKTFVFSEREGVKLSDNGFDLVPGDEPRLVRVEGGSPDELDWNWVGR